MRGGTCTVVQLVQTRGGTYTAMQLVKMRGEILYNIHLLCNLCKFVQTQYSNNLLCNLCRWSQTCAKKGWNMYSYATCANEGWNTYSYVTCANEGWNSVQYSFVMQFVQIRGGTQYSIHLWILYCVHVVELRVQCLITMATKLFRPITDHGMHGWRWYSSQ